MRVHVIAGLVAASALAACSDALRHLANDQPVLPSGTQRRVVDGDPALGRALLAGHGCTSCHVVPGERAPTGHVGPPLSQFARRTNIAGHAPNEPEVLVRFLMNSPQVVPGTAMPNLQVSETEARHIAALLYTLQ